MTTTTEQDTATTTESGHPFEHLGPAPYRILGVEIRRGPIKLPNGSQVGAPGQPMGTCHHCGTGIAEIWTIRSADGKTHEIGNICIAKAGKDYGDKPLLDEHRRIKLERDREKRAAKAEAESAELDALLEDQAVRAELQAKPHPRGFTDRETGAAMTLLDWVTWMADNAGAAGRGKTLRALRKELSR